MLIAAFGGGVSIWIINFHSSARIREAHAHFVIRQITERLDQIDDADVPRTPADLIAQLGSAGIDWNSCGIHRGQILDGWGSPIKTTFDGKTGSWAFRSLGRDGRSGTADDIEGASSIRK